MVWIQAAWFRTSAQNHGTLLLLLGGLGSQNLNSCSPSFSLTDSTSGSGETALKKPFHRFSGENALLASLFSPKPPLRGHCVCKILKWLWRKHMKLWYAKNGKGFSPTLYTVHNVSFSVQYHYLRIFLNQECLDLCFLGSELCQKPSIGTWYQVISGEKFEFLLERLQSHWRAEIHICQ